MPPRRHRIFRIGTEIAIGRAQPGHAAKRKPVRPGIRLPGAPGRRQRRIGVDQHDGFRQTLADRHAGILHHAAGGRAVGTHDVHQREILKPKDHLRADIHVARDVRVDQQSIDVGLPQAGVIECQRDRFGSEIDRAAAVDLAHRRDAKPDDRALWLVRHGCSPAQPARDGISGCARRHRHPRTRLQASCRCAGIVADPDNVGHHAHAFIQIDLRHVVRHGGREARVHDLMHDGERVQAAAPAGLAPGQFGGEAMRASFAYRETPPIAG